MISFRKLVQFLRNFYKIELIYSKKKNVEKKKWILYPSIFDIIKCTFVRNNFLT